MEDSYILWPNSSIRKISDPYVQGNLYKYIDCGIICHCEKKKVERLPPQMSTREELKIL